MIPAFTPASSIRVCPGFCFAPAVMTTTCEPSTTEMSLPPMMSLVPVNCVPCERSRASASTFSVAMSYSATWRADPRISAAYAVLAPTLPAPTTVSLEFSITLMRTV